MDGFGKRGISFLDVDIPENNRTGAQAKRPAIVADKEHDEGRFWGPFRPLASKIMTCLLFRTRFTVGARERASNDINTEPDN